MSAVILGSGGSSKWVGKMVNGNERELKGGEARLTFKGSFIEKVRNARGVFVKIWANNRLDGKGPTKENVFERAAGTKRSREEGDDGGMFDPDLLPDGTKRPAPGICGTFGCPLPNNHMGLHQLPEGSGMGQRSRRPK